MATAAPKPPPAKATPIKQSPIASRDTPPLGQGVHMKVAWVQAHVGWIEKTAKVEVGRGYKAMQEHKLIEELQPLMRACCLTSMYDAPSHEVSGNHYVVSGRLRISDPESGEVIEAFYPGEGSDSQAKGFGKALTTGHKYALQKFFRIATDQYEADEESRGPDTPEVKAPAPKAAAKKIPAKTAADFRATAKELIAEKKLTAAKITAGLQANWDVDNFDSLPAEKAKEVGEWLVALMGERA